jgi:hypothetical protein
VETNHADDVVVVYTDHDHDAYNHFANSEEAVALLEQRLDELVAEEIAAAGDEEVVRPGGACQCTDGSDYAFFVRHADPTKVMVTLGGGGACFSTDCDEGTPTEPPAPDGIFDFGRPENPFRDYTVVHVSYCTGDVHLGDNTAQSPSGRLVHFNGWINGAAAREHLAANFPDAAQVVVIGLSAGAVAAPLYAAAISDQLPDARIIVLADSSGAYPDAANPMLGELWGMGTDKAGQGDPRPGRG